MIHEYRKKHRINYTESDQNVNLGVEGAITLVQNMMTQYFKGFNNDNILLKDKYKAIWVVTKTKIHFNKFPKWNELVEAECFTTKVKPIRVEQETVLRNKKEEFLFVAKQEICVIDLETRKIKKINTVAYPENMEIRENVLKKPYLRLKDEFYEEDYSYKQKVRFSDIDFSRHTNNVMYVKYVLNTLPVKFFDENKVTDFEIHYISESKEGQQLKIYKKEEDKVIKFLIKEGEREVVRACLKYNPLCAIE